MNQKTDLRGIPPRFNQVGFRSSAYICGSLVAKTAKRRKRRSKNTIDDERVIAEALALLRQSRIASNLNQLAYHANNGALISGEAEKALIAEANQHLKAIRRAMMRALRRNP